MARRLVEELVVPEAQALDAQELRRRHGGGGMEDEVVQDRLDQPAAQAVERVPPRMVRLSSWVEEPATDEMSNTPSRPLPSTMVLSGLSPPNVTLCA